jgi:hypothetical protein
LPRRSLCPFKPPVAPVEFAQSLRCPRRKQARQARRGAELMRSGSELLGLGELALEQSLSGLEQGLESLFVSPAYAKSSHMGRKRERVPHRSDQKVRGYKGDEQENDKQIERNLDAPRMQHEERVTFVAAQRNRERRRERKRGEQPQQAFHLPDRSRDAL